MLLGRNSLGSLIKWWREIPPRGWATCLLRYTRQKARGCGVVQLPGDLGNKWAKGFLCLWKLSLGLKVDSLYQPLKFSHGPWEALSGLPMLPLYLLLLFIVSLGPVPLSCLSLLLVPASHFFFLTVHSTSLLLRAPGRQSSRAESSLRGAQSMPGVSDGALDATGWGEKLRYGVQFSSGRANHSYPRLIL